MADWISYPAILPTTFAVGAIDYFDFRWDYSQYGPELDIVAPSGSDCLMGDMWTLDQMVTIGYNIQIESMCGTPINWDCGPSGNDWDYDCRFGGTSAACAVVSGTASLILAKDSTLTVDEVYDILKYSAVTDLDWDPLPDTPHVEYGYGRVDAFRAILSLSRGDVDNDGGITVGDVVYLVDYVFHGGPEPFPSRLLGDCDCDGVVTVGDTVWLVDYVFFSGAPPVKPCFEF